MRFVGTKDQDFTFVDEPINDMRGIEKESLETAIGAPADQLSRSVMIQARCKSPTQSGRRVFLLYYHYHFLIISSKPFSLNLSS